MKLNFIISKNIALVNIIDARFAEEHEALFDALDCAEYVLEKKR